MNFLFALSGQILRSGDPFSKSECKGKTFAHTSKHIGKKFQKNSTFFRETAFAITPFSKGGLQRYEHSSLNVANQ
ncbi:MAG: hypothetical protein H6568_12370 [Lewinellaceae bacterium]|nr:hypothetical protein [Lewinellaceae bacterium]